MSMRIRSKAELRTISTATAPFPATDTSRPRILQKEPRHLLVHRLILHQENMGASMLAAQDRLGTTGAPRGSTEAEQRSRRDPARP
jgi:hypothetical protein